MTFEPVLKRLYHELLWGRTFYKTWLELVLKLQQNREVLVFGATFFRHSAMALRVAALTSLGRLIDDHAGAVNLRLLWRLAEYQRHQFMKATPEEVTCCVATFQRVIRDHPARRPLLIARHKIWAHIDHVQLTNQQWLTNAVASATKSDVQDLFVAVYDALNRCALMWNNTQLGRQDLYHDDLSALIEMIRSHPTARAFAGDLDAEPRANTT